MRVSALTTGAPAALASAALGTAGASAARRAWSQRPHSRVATYDRGEVRVRGLQADVHRAGHRLRVHVVVELRNAGTTAITRYVHVGRCVSGTGDAPRCPHTTTFRVRAGPDTTVGMARDVTVHQPRERADAVEISLTRTRAQPSRYAGRTDGQLLLMGNAWRGRGAGRVYGVRFPAEDDRATRVSFDVPLVAPGQAYISAVWNGIAAPGAPTTIARCTGADCAARALKPARARSGPQRFGARFDYRIQGADAVQLQAHDADGTPLLEAALPWPA